ncbi:MAG: O-methyltransferase [Solirubrobacteraceae bacterium]
MSERTPSYERVNYRLRPAKHVERGMILEALQRLSVFAPLRQYRYIGFGSTYFADFIVVHRVLGINKMISIEEDEAKRARFLFNRPFRTVKLIFGHSNAVLPTLAWTTPSIVWLDYDGPLTNSVLADIGWVCSAAASGSVLIVTVRADPGAISVDDKGARIRTLKKNIGAKNVPNGITNDGHLADWRLAEVGRTVIDSTIREAVRDRSTRAAQMSYEQLFNFHYRDGVRMSTVGGVLLDAGHRSELDRCSFKDLSYIKSGSDACLISVPFLTNREVRWLDRHLPATAAGTGVAMIPQRDRDAYADIYRFFPTFVDAEF